MFLGATYEIAWELNPRKIKIFEKSYRFKKREDDENNFLLGKYIQIAIGCALNKDNKYPEKPLLCEFYEDFELTEEERDEKELKKMLMYEDQFNYIAKQNGLNEVSIK